METVRIEARVPLGMDMELTSAAASAGETKATIIRQAVREWLDARRAK